MELLNWRYVIPTINQLVRKGRKRKQSKKQNALEGAPLLRGTVLRLFERDPRKPNSANRYCARVRLTNGTEVNCYVPGEREGRIVVQEHAQVLVRRGRVPDLSGVRYRIIRGALDAKGVESRKQGRSKYGTAR